ncbi:MAG: LysR family transcriptional regulator for metE and metH [Psychromonas sp.]|jgi:LysR family transcriptional regulator for metE and metH|uniref:LysR family transcriptional regulator n=1 Tax=Psychromonas sp. TaxID=1884585 RepID=UPI0039E60928
MIEPSHLKIMLALHEKGTLTQAADALCLTQSALSHQIRYLEKKLNVKLWQRYGRRLRLTAAGELLLQTAKKVLPTLLQTEQALKAMGDGVEGLLRIGVECFPCNEWLTQVVAHSLQRQPNVDIDIIRQFHFSGIEGLLNHHVDLLITPDKIDHKLLQHYPLFDYEQVLLVSDKHPLAKQRDVSAEQLQSEVLFTFPIEKQRLDIYQQFLWPAKVQPKGHKQIESLAIMLQMVEYQRGVCVLPEWLADSSSEQYGVKKLRLGNKGIHKTLYAMIKKQDQSITYINNFIEFGKKNALAPRFTE